MLRTITPYLFVFTLLLVISIDYADAQTVRTSVAPSVDVADSEIQPDDPITVTFEGSQSARDWIGIYKADETPSRHNPSEFWLYVNGSRTAGNEVPQATMPLHNHDLKPGDYAAWLLADDGYEPLADPAPFTITSSSEADRRPIARVPEGDHREAELLPLINEARSEARMCGDEYFQATGPVVWSEDLAIVALDHSNDMTSNIFRGHTGSDGSSPHERVRDQTSSFVSTGEILSYFYANVEGAVEGWLNSPGHCRIIMGDSYTHMGGAIQHGPRFDNPNREGAYRTAVFGGLPGGQAEFDATSYAEANDDFDGAIQEQRPTTPTLPPTTSSPFEGATILVYGHEQCGNTSALRRDLANQGIAYEMRNVREEMAYNHEMWEKIRESTGTTGSVMLPVVEVDGALVNGTTSVEQLKHELEGDE